MQDQATAPRHGVVIASGFGLKIYVDRGHLVVHDGIADERCTQRFPRVGSGVKRLVVLGQAGYVTLEALRWLRDIGSAFAQLDSDGRLVALSAGVGTDQPSLRRAQALAAEGNVGLELARVLLADKVSGQAAVLSQLGGGTTTLTAALEGIAEATALEALLEYEASAALAYWEAWSEIEVRFGTRDRQRVPRHWLTFGQRHSPVTGSPRLAVNPANAILNYLYSLVEAEATLACHTVGLDPGLGIFHTDRKARDSLALDLMEVCRPTVDAYVLALLERRVLAKQDFIETRRGVCRLLPALAGELASTTLAWRRQVALVAESAVRMLSGNPSGGIPTPLTQSNRTRAWQGRGRKPRRRRPIAPDIAKRCERCGGSVPNQRRRYCDACRREQAVEAGAAGRSGAAAVLTELRQNGRDPAHRGEAGRRRATKNAAHQRALREWEARHREKPDLLNFGDDVLPLLRDVRLSELTTATGLSTHYCSLIRLGKRVPHPRHWAAFREVAERRLGRNPSPPGA